MGTDGTFSDIYLNDLVGQILIGGSRKRGTSRLSPSPPQAGGRALIPKNACGWPILSGLVMKGWGLLLSFFYFLISNFYFLSVVPGAPHAALACGDFELSSGRGFCEMTKTD
jgi:hypothetical protein